MDKSPFIIKAIASNEYPLWRESLYPYLENFSLRSKGSFTIDDFEREILDNKYQVWVVVNDVSILGCALTFIRDDATKTCVISHCAGHDYKQWAGQGLATIRVWSHSFGSTKLEAITRPGWERVLGKFGMIKTHVVLELEDNGRRIKNNDN